MYISRGELNCFPPRDQVSAAVELVSLMPLDGWDDELLVLSHEEELERVAMASRGIILRPAELTIYVVVFELRARGLPFILVILPC